MKKFRKVLDGLTTSSPGGTVGSPSCGSAAGTPTAAPTPKEIDIQETLVSENFQLCKVGGQGTKPAWIRICARKSWTWSEFIAAASAGLLVGKVEQLFPVLIGRVDSFPKQHKAATALDFPLRQLSWVKLAGARMCGFWAHLSSSMCSVFATYRQHDAQAAEYTRARAQALQRHKQKAREYNLDASAKLASRHD